MDAYGDPKIVEAIAAYVDSYCEEVDGAECDENTGEVSMNGDGKAKTLYPCGLALSFHGTVANILLQNLSIQLPTGPTLQAFLKERASQDSSRQKQKHLSTTRTMTLLLLGSSRVWSVYTTTKERELTRLSYRIWDPTSCTTPEVSGGLAGQGMTWLTCRA